MNYTFKPLLRPSWSLTDDSIIFKGTKYSLADITDVKVITMASSMMDGILNVHLTSGKMLALILPSANVNQVVEALDYLQTNYGSAERKAYSQAKAERENDGLIYNLHGVRGRSMKVYEDRCVIKVRAGAVSFLTGNASDGEKTIYYQDCIGVQFKESGLQIGYIQLETASRIMNNGASNFFNENSFTFDTSVQTNELMSEVAEYIRSQISSIKNGKNQPVVAQVSPADELKKFKDLLDSGVITQEEFDAKKKQLLGL